MISECNVGQELRRKDPNSPEPFPVRILEEFIALRLDLEIPIMIKILKDACVYKEATH
jgi:hypothetical protein